MKRISPLGALFAGFAAGALGSLAQDLFFASTSRIAPHPPGGAFVPPENQQREEMPTQTVARRVVEGMLQRGPLESKERAGRIVHYAFGAAWGGAYGLLAASSKAMATATGALGFGVAVWMASDNLILPAFRLAAWPSAYPAKSHAYAVAAHLVYGGAVWAAYEAIRTRAWSSLATAVGAAWATRSLPSFARPRARRLLGAAHRVRTTADAALSALPS